MHELVSRDEPMSQHTTLRLGGPAAFFARAGSWQDLRSLCLWAREQHLPLFLLGGGSNLVVADGGVPGLVVRMDWRGIQVVGRDGPVTVVAAAGTPLDELVAFTVAEGWAGLECLSGIPGTVGATPIQNVGAYGQEVGERILWVEVFHPQRQTLLRLSPAQCRFTYRNSRFRHRRNRFLITRVAFWLQPGGRPTLAYPELRRLLEVRQSPPSLGQVREAVLQLRKQKGMLLSGAEPWGSAGSFFKNPVLPASAWQSFKQRAWAEGVVAPGEEPPHWPTASGLKLPAAWLVEHAAFPRGLRRGSVGLSPHHALALVHWGGGSTEGLLALAAEIQQKVAQTFGLLLEPEPVFWGFNGQAPLPGAVAW